MRTASFSFVWSSKKLSAWWVGVHLHQTTSYILMTVDAEAINPAANHTSDIFKVHFSLFFLRHFEFYLSKSLEGNVLMLLSVFSHLSLSSFNEIIEEQASFVFKLFTFMFLIILAYIYSGLLLKQAADTEYDGTNQTVTQSPIRCTEASRDANNQRTEM